MNTEFLQITENPEDYQKIINKAAEVIRKGGLVAIPTETVYGLAGSALLQESAEKIFAAKGRPADNPLIVHIAEPADAETLAETTPLYYRLAEAFMPGPLTVVLKKRDVIPSTVSAGLSTVAIRCPANRVAHDLIAVSTHPIAAPSANRSGIPSPTNAKHVFEDMDGRIDMILDGGSCDIGLESTVVKLEGDSCTILRPGAVTEDMLRQVCAEVRIAEAVLDPAQADGKKVESPGMKYKHYAPNAQLVLIDACEEDFVRYVNRNGKGKHGVLAPEESREQFASAVVLSTGKRGDVKEASRPLFDLLRQADEMELETVYAILPPPRGEHLALYNRIIRAAGCRITRP